MPIDFPNNPISGQTYSYAGQQWQYNGVAWNKLIIADDANALYGISGSIYASNLATGLLYGGILSINSGNTAQFDITAGRGQIHSSGSTYTSGPFPTFQYVNWPGQTGITLTYLATSDTTWIYVDSSGTVQQRPTYYTDEQLEENIIIGQLIHPSRTFINLARTNPNVAYATDKQYEQFIRSFGPIKISGHTIQPNGANLKLNRTSGTAFSLGRNWINDTDNPSVVSDPAQTDCTFFRYYRGATAGTFITVPNQTAIDPTKYDDGTGTLATVPGGKYTIQRIFYYPNTPTLLGVYYGRAEYTSLADAAANINFENFTEIENTKTNAIFVAYLLVKSGATDLTNTSDALILQAGNFRSTTSGGGSVSLTLDDLTDVIITSPQNYQVLAYVDGVTGWENLSVTSLPLVSSFNGLTGAVTGVTTGIENIFGPLQSFTNGISSAGGTFSTLARFTAGISASGATLSSNTIIPSGSTLTVNGNFVANGNVNLGDAVTDAITVAGLLAANGGLSAAGGTFSALARFTAGISASGGTFGSDISVYGIGIGRGNRGACAGGDTNLAVGANALISVIPNPTSFLGIQNLAFGTSALRNTTSGGYNSAFGTEALLTNTTGVGNIAFGVHALRQNLSGNENCAFGGGPLYQQTSGNNNVAIGSLSLYYKTTGSNNVAIGFRAGRNFGAPAGTSFISDANNSIYIGQDATGLANSPTNEMVIGYNTVGFGSNTLTLGNTAINNTYIRGLINANSGISSAGGTFSALTRFIAGISASGATLSLNTTIPSGATLSIAGVVSSDNGYRISSNAINAQTGTTYTFLTTDDGKIVTFNNGSTITVTVPTGLPVGFNCTAIQLGTGQVGFTAASGVTLQSYGNQYRLIGQHASASIIEYTTNIVNLSGNLII